MRRVTIAYSLGLITSGVCIMIFLTHSVILDKPHVRRNSSFQRRVVTKQSHRETTLRDTRPASSGCGENGTAVMLTAEQRRIVKDEIRRNRVSRFMQSKVSLERKLPDYRNPQCRALSYPQDLAKASVILIFHNELLRSLLRTVHSVINRTPPEYLHEVILVDDASTATELGTPLDDYILSTWPDVAVRVVRLVERSGLIRTRLAGVAAATGEVVVIMDGHMEVTQGWMEPLLNEIKRDNKTLVAPVVDWIEVDTMKYQPYQDDKHQTFTWDFLFTLRGSPTTNRTEPLPSYALVGCAFAMNRQVFLDMGSFDSGMELWGAENIELPIRIWMCGGRVYVQPCSRVGHGFRPLKPGTLDFLQRNAQRVAEVWFDEYIEDFYTFYPHLKGSHDYGDISERVALRKRLNCKSFRWFAKEILKPPLVHFTEDVRAYGQLRNQNRCLDHLRGAEHGVGAYTCMTPRSGSQFFLLTDAGVLKTVWAYVSLDDNRLMYHSIPDNEDDIKTTWMYRKETEELVHLDTSLCLGLKNERGRTVHAELGACNGASSQKWQWEKLT